MEQEASTREDLESVIRDLPDDVVEAGGIKVAWPIATSSVSDGKVTTRNIFGGKSCAQCKVLDVAGRGITQSDGTAILRLNDFHCEYVPPGTGTSGIAYELPITVVATARDSAVVHLAVEAHIETDPSAGTSDVLITVRSWATDGTPVAAGFNWRCTVPFVPAIG